VRDQQVALEPPGEITAGEHLHTRTGPSPLLIDLRRSVMLERVIQMAGEESAMIRVGPGAVVDDVLAPAVPDMAMRISERIGYIDIEFLRARLIAENAGIGAANRRTIGGLDLSTVKRAFLKVERSARIECKAVGSMMRVR